MFIGRENELAALEELYRRNDFQMFVLYGRRRVGKTTLLNEFCRDKDAIFYSALQTTDRSNLEKFSEEVFGHYGLSTLEPFTSWENALSFIQDRQEGKQLVVVLDEFPYLAWSNPALLSGLQHLVDHKLQYGKLFLIVSGSYMGFMEKEVLGSKSPLFGRRTAQLHMKSFDYRTAVRFLDGFGHEDKLKLYGACGGTAIYLRQIRPGLSFGENIRNAYLRVTSYLYEEPLLLLRQEVRKPEMYSAVIEAIADGASKANEIAMKTGEESAKCIKYINTLCELGILYKEFPFGEKSTSRNTIYRIADFMFRFWYRYVFGNRTLIETGASDAVYKRRIEPDYDRYMGVVFERVCRDYLLARNAAGDLPILFSSIGRWWGTDPVTRKQEEIDLIAADGDRYLICECKWRNEKADMSVLRRLREKADAFSRKRGDTWYVIMSRAGFTSAVSEEASRNDRIVLIDLETIMKQN